MDGIEHFPALMKLAYGAFVTRLVLVVALLMTFGLFSWAIWLGTVLSLIAAGVFAVLVFLPILLRKETTGGSNT